MTKNKDRDRTSISYSIAQSNRVQTHGEAASQMIQAYKGIRVDSLGKEINHYGRSLKEVSNYSVNPKYSQANYKQQAGFSAELIKEARDNKSSILNGSETRTRTTDGIGRTNDQYHDFIKLDAKGNVISGSGSQMKMLGKFSTDDEIRKSSEAIVNKIVSDDWKKYQGSPIDLPSEQVEYAKEFATIKAKDLREQAKKCRLNGDNTKASSLEEKARRYDIAREDIRDSGVYSKEAMEARMNPKRFVQKEVLSDANKSGIEAAKSSFILAGTISGAQNIYSVIFENKDFDEAVEDTLKSTALAVTSSYITSASGTVVKSMMHSSKSNAVRALGKTSAPTMIVTSVLEVGKSMCRYANGDIDEEELLLELGEKGTGMVAASYGTAIGTAILPGIGTVVGSIVGYTVSSMLYNGALSTLTNARIARERRLVIEKLAEQSISQIKMYEKQFREQASATLKYQEELFNDILSGMRDGILNDNIDDFFINVNTLGNYFGFDLQFSSFDEFDKFMSDEDSILVL